MNLIACLPCRRPASDALCPHVGPRKTLPEVADAGCLVLRLHGLNSFTHRRICAEKVTIRQDCGYMLHFRVGCHVLHPLCACMLLAAYVRDDFESMPQSSLRL